MFSKTGEQRSHGAGVPARFYDGLDQSMESRFWLAVIGGQQSVTRNPTFGNSLAFAASVVLGALVWTLVFSVALKQGARIFARPAWQVATQAVTSLLMLFFAAKLFLTLR